MKTKTRFHKLTAWLLTLAMLMTFIPSFTLEASAEGETIGHIHSICGEEHTEIGDHNSVGCAEVTYAAFPTATDSDTSDGITATVSDGKVAVTLVGGEESKPKTYNLYLNGDIALSKPLNIPAYTTLNLCLNGFALDASAASESIYQQVALLIGGTASTLNLCDCNGSYNIHKFTADDTGKWTMDESGNQEISGGVIIGGSVDNSGTFNMYGGSIVGASKRGVLNRYNSINSTFNMYAGEIVGNADGGVDCNYTEFTLYDGKIHNNVTVKNGAGILANYTTFNMYGGEIYKNTSTYEPETNKINGGGGVFFNGNASNVFTMTGGKIHNNSAARDGGGVLIQGAAFSLSGGEISENITAKKGGGVILDTFNTVSISGGSITGNKAEIGGGAYSIGGGDVQLSGRVKITDNTLADGSTASNLYLARTENILQLSVTGALENEAHIGVSMEIPDIFTTAGTYTVTNDVKTKFTSDSDAYEVELTDGVLSLQPMVPRVATPENPRWLYTSAAFWDAVDGATGYALKLYAGGTTEAHLVQRLSVGNEVSAYLYNILSGIVDDADLDSAEFYFSVRAKGNNYTTADSEWSEIIGPQTHVQPVPVLIVTQPTTQSVMVGSSATFSITAAGDSPITYQWQFSKDDGSTWENVLYNQTDSTLSGTTATYTVNNVTTDMNGWQYRCVATNMSGTKTATSEAVTLAVKEIFTVTFNANGGTCETTSAETVDGKLAELPTPTYDGYVFNGWFDAAEGGNKITISTVFDADTTIYAQWTQKIVITADMITVDEETYNGEQQLPNETIIVNGQPLVRNVDYSVQVWPDANYYRDAGEWEFFIHMDMNPVYIGEKIRMVQTIHKATPTITAPSAIPDLIYDGSKQVLINAGSTTGGTIQYSLDNASWSTELPMATNAGEYTVYYKVVGDSNYKDVGAVSTLVTIAPASLADAIVTLDEDTFTYDGQPHKPGVTVELNGKTLTVGTDYQVTYRVPLKLTGDKPTEWMDPNIVPVTFTDAGIMYYAVIEGMGNYYTENDTTLYARFRIEPKEVTAPTFADLEESYLYQDGAEIKPTFNLMDGDKKILAREYTVSYSNNTEVGTATITITDKAGGNYTVSGSTTFEIVVHEHVWNYTASGDTITATCSGTIGTCPVENNTVTIKLNAPENLTYDGNAKNVTVTQTPAGVFGDIPAVTYVGDCMNCATHTANLTYGEKTASLDFTIEKATISNVSFDVTAPEAGAVPQNTITAGTNYSAEIAWNETVAKFGFNTVYTATVTLTADENHKFADDLNKEGWDVALNIDKTVATLTKTFDATRKQKIESVTVPTNVNLDTHRVDANAVIATLPTTVSVTLEGNETDTLAIVWNCTNFKTTPLHSNTFIWTATNSKYDINNVVLGGAILVTNPVPNAVTITVKTENTSVVYNASDIDLTSLFDIDSNAGDATYTVTNETGAGTQNGTKLSVTKAGTFTVKVNTAENGIYAAGTRTATLTVSKADGTGTVSMSGWTYGETAQEPAVSDNKGAATYQYKVKGADDTTYSPDKPSNAGGYTVKATFAATDLYNEATATADFTIAQKDITGATVSDFAQLAYTGQAQTPSATVTIGNLTVTGTWSNVTNVADKSTFTANGNFTGTIADKETGMAKADPTYTEPTVKTNLVYNGSAQELLYPGTAEGGTMKYFIGGTEATETVTTGTSAGEYTVKCIVAGDENHNNIVVGEYTVTIAKKTIDNAIILTAPVKNAAPQTEITGTGYTATVVWSPEVTDKFAYNTEYTATVTITPDDNHTVTGITANGYTVEGAKTVTNDENSNVVTVTYEKTGSRPSSGGGSSNTSTTTTKNEDGSTTKTTTNKATGTTTEVTTNTDGSTTTVETKKDGTVTTTEKDKDGNTTTTVENPDGTSTTTEKNKDGSETVVEKDAEGTTTTTQKDSEGNKTVTTEKADGTTTTVETKKDGTKVTTETNADGETTAQVEAKGEKEVVIPVLDAEDVTKVVVTDKDGNETEVEFEVKDGGVAISVSGNSTVSVQTGHTCYAKDFTDVDLEAWYHLNVDYVLENGLFKGTTETTFAPNANLTRAMLVTVLYRAEGEPKVSGITSFADLEKGQYYLDAVCWAQINGIVNGVSETEFAPNDNITREQIAAIMHRYAQYKGYDVSIGENTNILSYDDFDDISEYAIASMQYACGSGLMKGKTASTLNPKDNATRAEIAAVLHRFIEANK